MANDSYSTAKGNTLTVTAPGVLDNDSDPENDPLTVTLQSDVMGGTLALSEDGSFVYTPTQEFSGQDSFSYIVNDGLSTNRADVSINVVVCPDSSRLHVKHDANSMDGGYVTLESPAGTMLVDVNAVANPSTSDTPEQVGFPQGFFDFNASGMTVGQTVVITLTLHTGETPTAYWKYGPTADDPTDHWYLFDYDGTTGAQINGNVITLHFVDGARGDSDLQENGQISDPGAPAIDADPTALTLNNIESQAATPWPAGALLALLGVAGVLVALRRKQ